MVYLCLSLCNSATYKALTYTYMSYILFHVMSLQQTNELVARNGNYALIFRMTSMAVHTELSSG